MNSELRSITEVAKELNTTEKYLESLISKHGINIKTEKINDKYFFHKDEVFRILKNRERGIHDYIIVPDKYITFKEISEKYNVNEDLSSGILKPLSYIKISNVKFWVDEEVREYLRLKDEFIQLSISCDWIKVDSLSRKLQTNIKTLIKENKIHQNLIKTFFIDRSTQIIIHKDLYKTLIPSDFYKRVKSSIKIDSVIKVDDIYDINEVESKIDLILSQNIDEIGKFSLNIDKIIEITAISNKDILAEIRKENFTKYINIKVKDMYTEISIYEGGIRKLLRIKNFLSIQELARITMIHQTILLESVKAIIKEDNEFCVYFTQNTFVNKNVALKGYIRCLKNSALLKSNFNEILQLRLRLIKTPFKTTFKLATEYLEKEISRLNASTTSSKKEEFGRSINAIDEFIDTLSKELFFYNNDEIDKLILNPKLKISHFAKVSAFINYVKNKLGTECKYTKRVGKSLVNQLTQENGEKNTKSETYTDEIWGQYYLFLSDIDRHIHKAFESERYSQTWLYCLLQLSITWRSKDIINKIPNIPLEIIGINSFDWFTNGNSFTLSMAIKVLDFIQFSLDGVIAYKNKMNLHFNVPISLKIPTAISLIIAEIHRNTNKEEIIFFSLNKKHLTKKADYEKFFSDNIDLADFSNITATRTLLTLNFATAVKTVGMAGVAYTINTYSRSHKQEVGNISNTTATYFRFSNIDGSPADVAYQTFERGMFGYLYIKLLIMSFSNDEINSLSQEQLTELIKEMKTEISPMTIEKLFQNLSINKENVDFEINLINIFEKIKKMPEYGKNHLLNILDNTIVEKYKEVALNLFPNESDMIQQFIDEKCMLVNEYFSETNNGSEFALKVFNDIRNGDKNCFTDYSNCIFDDLERKKKCPVSGHETCIGCIYNVPNIMQLYEINETLNGTLDEMLSNDYSSEKDLIKDTAIINNYVYLIIQAKAQFEKMDKNFLSAFFNEAEIKLKIKRLHDLNKLIYIKQVLE